MDTTGGVVAGLCVKGEEQAWMPDEQKSLHKIYELG